MMSGRLLPPLKFSLQLLPAGPREPVKPGLAIVL